MSGAAAAAAMTDSPRGGIFPAGRLEETPADGGGLAVVDISGGIYDARY